MSLQQIKMKNSSRIMPRRLANWDCVNVSRNVHTGAHAQIFIHEASEAVETPGRRDAVRFACAPRGLACFVGHAPSARRRAEGFWKPQGRGVPPGLGRSSASLLGKVNCLLKDQLSDPRLRLSQVSLDLTSCARLPGAPT